MQSGSQVWIKYFPNFAHLTAPYLEDFEIFPHLGEDLKVVLEFFNLGENWVESWAQGVGINRVSFTPGASVDPI